jgi:DNA-binding GntR family transcriptional regulator
MEQMPNQGPVIEESAEADAGRITADLRSAIWCGEFHPGQPLRQSEIAKRFGVSHIPVREAFQQLASDGLVVALRNRGVVVSELSIAEVRELTELRSLLEVRMIGWALPHLAPFDLAEADGILDQIDATDAVDEIMRLNGAFHQLLYRKAERPLILGIIDKTRLNLGRYLRLAWDRLDYLPRSQQDHRMILSLCRAGASAELGEVLDRHIRRTGDVIIAYLSR